MIAGLARPARYELDVGVVARVVKVGSVEVVIGAAFSSQTLMAGNVSDRVAVPKDQIHGHGLTLERSPRMYSPPMAGDVNTSCQLTAACNDAVAERRISSNFQA